MRIFLDGTTSRSRELARRPAKIRAALQHLRIARDLLKQAKAPKATEAVRRAIHSTEGAQRHAALAPQRTQRQENR